MQTVVSLDANSGMKEQTREYMLSLNNVSDATKEQHARAAGIILTIILIYLFKFVWRLESAR